MKEQEKYLSPNKRALKRLLKNKPAVGGLIVIFLAIMIAILGYLIVPDSTPDANDQILEIATEQPSFSKQMLLKRKNRSVQQRNIFGKMLFGQDNPYQMIPINSYKIDGKSIICEVYGGTSGSTSTDTIALADVVHPIKAGTSIIDQGNQVSLTNLDGKTIEVSVDDLVKTVKDKHLKQKTYFLGTDKYGRDNLSRLILGIRVSLSVGLIAVVISLLIGITIGSIGGYFGGVVDDVVMWLINVFWSIPLLLLVFALILAFGREFWQIFLAVGLTMWVELARIVRGQILSLREKEFVEAAESLGFSNFRTIVRHILPNTVGPVVVITAANFATAIIIEAGLSFLGIGVQPPTPSWGTMLNEYYNYVGTNKAFLAIFPGLAISILVLAFNLVGNGLRDAMDVKTRAL